MKKKLWLLLLLLPSIVWGFIVIIGSWNNVGNSLMRSNDGFKFRTDMGSNKGFVYWYQLYQVDSIAALKQNTIATGTNLQYFDGVFGLHTFPTNLSSFANGPGYLTAITSGQVTGALGYTPYNATNPNNYITISSVPTNLSSFTNDVPYATLSQAKASLVTALFGQTGSISSVGTYSNTGTDNTFTVSAWLNLLFATSDSVKVAVAWTDGHGVAQTSTFMGYKVNASSGNMGTVRDYMLFTGTVRAEVSTNIVVSTSVTGSGSILYEVGCAIEKKVGNGGL